MLLVASDTVRTRRGRRFRLARRPLHLFTLMTILFLGLVMAVLAWLDRSSALATADRTSQTLALALERHVGRTMAELDGALLVMGEMLKHTYGAPETLDVRLRGMQARIATDGALALVDTSGRIVSASTQPVRRGLDLVGRQLFREALTEPSDGLFIGQGALIDREVSVGVARRVLDDSGALIGLAYGAISAQALDRFASEAGLPEEATMMLLEEDGTVLLRRPTGEDWIGRSLANDPLFIQFAPRLRPGTYHEIAIDDRVERITTYKTVQGFPIVISIGLPADAILVPWRERSSKLLLVWVLTALSLTLIAGLVAAQARKAAERSRERH